MPGPKPGRIIGKPTPGTQPLFSIGVIGRGAWHACQDGADRTKLTAVQHPTMIDTPAPMTSRLRTILRAVLIVGGVLAAITGSDAIFSGGFILWRPDWARNELVLYLVAKGGFALVLGLCFTIWRGWRRFGFRGGLHTRHWPMLLPLWIAASASASEGLGIRQPLQVAGWLLLALLIGFGEESVFRGIIPDALLGSPKAGTPIAPSAARRAIVVSALLFGLAHLGGLAVPSLDRHVVLGQAAFATGIGLALGWVRLRSASIWPGLIAHVTLDSCGILASGGIAKAMTATTDSYNYLWFIGGFALIWGIVLVMARPVSPGPERNNMAGAEQ
jgi:membrane protease YdiL (CAAX protease family)